MNGKRRPAFSTLECGLMAQLGVTYKTVQVYRIAQWMREFCVGAEDMTQWIKCFPCTREDLSSHPQPPCTMCL